jgi:two-component system sensor histidine kinase/response regulator
VTVLPIDFNGSLWKAQFVARKVDLISGFDLYLPWIALLTGFIGTPGVLRLYGSCCMASAAARREQRRLLDSVLNNVDAHVYMKDEDRRYIYVNAKMAQVMGKPVEEIVGRLDRELMPAAAGPRMAGGQPGVHAGVKRSSETQYTDATAWCATCGR